MIRHRSMMSGTKGIWDRNWCVSEDVMKDGSVLIQPKALHGGGGMRVRPVTLHKEFVDLTARGVLTDRPGSVQLVGGDVEQGHLAQGC
jgi:hypothetical protein